MKYLRDFFNLSVGEMRAAILLLLLTVLTAFLPHLWPDRQVTATDFSAFCSMRALEPRGADPDDSTGNTGVSGRPFIFDPNTASSSALMRLGMKRFIAERIVRYRKAGGSFSVPEDLYNIYGADSALIHQLLPYVRISVQSRRQGERPAGHSKDFRQKRKLLELNGADTGDLIALPMIGSKLAARIVAYREKLGGFFQVDQLREVYGLRPETFELIGPMLSADAGKIIRIPVNSADRTTLGRHPYIGFRRAQTMVSYREQHGPFRESGDLMKLVVFSEEEVRKLNYYLGFE